MSRKPFRFKYFTVDDHRCTHKVGTDGVLLGSWVNILEDDRMLLDIGTGSGLIALMLAQRSNPGTHIDAVEIEEQDANAAALNVQNSPWPQKITIWHNALQDFSPDKRYDLIVSNPPFFVSSLHPPDRKRIQARHAQQLSFDDLLTAVNHLLEPMGRFAVILPSAEGQAFTNLAASFQLTPFRVTRFRSRRHKPVERLLIEFQRGTRPLQETDIVLYGTSDQWSDAYKALTRDFYLNT